MQVPARIENHYVCGQGIFLSDSCLLDDVDKIWHIRTVIVQVCVASFTQLM